MKSLFSFVSTVLHSDLQTSSPRHLSIPIPELRMAFTRVMKISCIYFMINEFFACFFCATPLSALSVLRTCLLMDSGDHAVFEHHSDTVMISKYSCKEAKAVI